MAPVNAFLAAFGLQNSSIVNMHESEIRHNQSDSKCLKHGQLNNLFKWL